MPPDFGPRRFSNDSFVTKAMCKRSFAPLIERHYFHGMMLKEGPITNQCNEDGSRTHNTFMDPRLYVATKNGAIHVLQQCVDIHVQLNPKRTQLSIEGHLIVVEILIEAAKQLHGDTERGIQQFVWPC
ncbi:hypothetical protein AAG906_012098 [Vitis piasezkii]